ncbi:hypothetical protein PRZ48_008575 [Zasmidium cellare]|uniref:Heterokaryon incompatibility domain-containing protein n=1 Tax=Zasmidium cellare TaxID=395010 RepID=A0ABR0EFU7_ZASCE|nr:hypothetical protein PRZ48_008575 [Zasmidium cellare]
MQAVSASHREVSTFQHEQLSDPSKQIRLLKYLPSVDDDEIDLEISTHSLENAPDYQAISYTWGEIDLTPVTVNSQTLDVRRNCHYALWQVRLHYSSDYIWIDSICIDQSNLREKGIQVSIMFEIYSRASRVLACVGPHENNSKLFLQLNEPHVDLARRDMNAYQSFSVADYHFTFRPNFRRLWVVQELFAARKRLEILCGADRFSWTQVCLMRSYDPNGDEEAWYKPGNPTRIMPRPEPVPLEVAFTTIGGYVCSDPRDQIYGRLALIKCPPGCDPIMPGYERGTFSLARQLTDYMDDGAIEEMLRALKVSHKTQEMKDLVAARQSIQVDDCGPPYGEERKYSRSEYISGRKAIRFSRLEEDEEGNLTASLLDFFDVKDDRVKDQEALSRLLTDSSEIASHLLQSRSLTGNRTIAASIPATARKGDILLLCDGHRYSRNERCFYWILLVLRHNHNDYYDIVGQGILPSTCGLDTEAYDNANQSYAKLEVSFTTEDMLCFVGQDLHANDVERMGWKHCDIEAYKWRLTTCPVLDLVCAAKITWEGGAEEAKRLPIEKDERGFTIQQQELGRMYYFD